MLDELHDLVADLQAYVAWEQLQGLQLLPVEAVPPPGRAPAAARPARPAESQRAHPAESQRARPADAARRPDSRPSDPGRPAEPRRKPAPAAAPAAASPAAPGPAAADRSATRTPLPGAWARLAKGGALVTGDPPGADAESLRGALTQAVALPDPGAGLAAVRQVMGDCKRCGLCARRENIVFGVGSPRARLVVLGEGPGEQEDRQAEPFVGPAGQMLDRMIENVLGLARGDVYILNMVKCRPPENRNPQPSELDACRPFLDAQLSILRPDLVLVLGSVASRVLFGPGISRTRGKWQELRWEGGSSRAMPTFHPAYLLRKPQDKRLTFQDLKLLREALDALPPRG